jgi:protein O-GlcNAc transferase
VNMISILFGPSRVLAEHEKHEEAITCFEAAIALLTISGDSCDRSQSPSTPPPSAPSENEDMVQAMVGKGISLGKLGRSVAAAQAFDAALELDGNSVEALTYLGLLRIREKRTEEGIELFRRALKREASHKLASESLATALTDEGTRLKLLAQSDDALSNYREAARVCPGYAPAYYNEGIVLAERGMVQQALESYARALKLWPRYFEAHNNRGVLLKGLDRLPEAIEAYRACLEINPNFELAAHNLSLALSDLGTAVKAQGRVQEAIHLYQQALYYNATSADVMYNLGVAYVENKEPLQAAIWYQLTIEVNPRSAEAYNNLGVIYKDMDNFPKALSCYEAALRIRPTFPEALNNMGVVMTILNQPEDALPYFNSALQVAPSYAEAYTNLGKLFQDAGDADKAIYYYEQSVALCPYVENAAHNRLLALNYSDGRSRDSVTAAHLAWGRDIRARALAAATSANSSALDAPENTLCLSRQLRVGYLSPDFNKHSVAYFAEALLRHHSKAHFHITCYSAGAKEDATSRRMRAHADSWVSVVGMPPLTVAQKIRADQIDILVELAGHTAGNRLDVMALRPAPVQVTYIGYPNTTGLETIQYRITDKYVDPPDTTQQFSEELIRLPDCFLCYSPPDECEVPPVSAPPSAALHYVTFGSFNNIAKINGRVVRLWARILLAVPESRLFLKSRAFAAKQVKESCLVAFAQYGVDRSCIDLHQVFLHVCLSVFRILSFCYIRFCDIRLCDKWLLLISRHVPKDTSEPSPANFD